MLRLYFERSGINTELAFEDADTGIVNMAIDKIKDYDSTEIIGEDIDLLVILTGLSQDKSNIFFRKPGRGKTPEALYSPASLKCGRSVAENILFLHAFSGCDTTSCLFNVGKSRFITTLQKHPELQSVVKIFQHKHVDPEELVSAGERFLVALYGGDKQEDSLNTLRYKRFAKSVTKTKFNLASLPPTRNAAKQHIFRTYHQIQSWLGLDKDPEDWGWRRTSHGLEPVQNESEPAPPQLLKMIACKCKMNCGAACGCRKAGIKCSAICLHCCGQTCQNTPEIDHTIDDPYENILEDAPINNQAVEIRSDDEDQPPKRLKLLI